LGLAGKNRDGVYEPDFEKLERLKLAEIKHSRLAMVAMLIFTLRPGRGKRLSVLLVCEKPNFTTQSKRFSLLLLLHFSLLQQNFLPLFLLSDFIKKRFNLSLESVSNRG
jgi:hypothetical protein